MHQQIERAVKLLGEAHAALSAASADPECVGPAFKYVRESMAHVNDGRQAALDLLWALNSPQQVNFADREVPTT